MLLGRLRTPLTSWILNHSCIIACSLVFTFWVLAIHAPLVSGRRAKIFCVCLPTVVTNSFQLDQFIRRRWFLLIWGVCELRAKRVEKGRAALVAAKVPTWSRIFLQREREVHCSQKRRAFASVSRIRLYHGTKATDRLEMEVPMTRCPTQPK